MTFHQFFDVRTNQNLYNMKSSIKLISTLIICITFASCFNGNKEQNPAEENFNYSKEEGANHQIKNETITQSSAIKYFNNIDSRNGMVMSSIPFPAEWKKETDGEYEFIGPNGIKVYKERGGAFMFSNDAQMNQIYQQNGMPIQFPKSIDQVVNENFMDYANNINRKLVRKYPMPQFAAWDKQHDDKLYTSMPSQKTFTVYGLEWQDPDGKMFLTVLHHFVSYDQAGGYWGVNYSVLETPGEIFQATKKQYLNGLLNQQTNPQWVQARNYREQQTAIASNAAHQDRMNNIKAIGASGTARHNERMSAMDQNMESWRANQAAGDRSHGQFIDYINDNTNVRDPNSGQTYKVEAGANQYWVNDQGEYIKSDNSIYNPNMDNNTNNQNWTEYEERN